MARDEATCDVEWLMIIIVVMAVQVVLGTNRLVGGPWDEVFYRYF